MTVILRTADDTELSILLVQDRIEIDALPRSDRSFRSRLDVNEARVLCRKTADLWNTQVSNIKRYPYVKHVDVRTIENSTRKLAMTRTTALHLISVLLHMAEGIDAERDRQYTIDVNDTHPRAKRLLTDALNPSDPLHPDNRGFDGPTGAE